MAIEMALRFKGNRTYIQGGDFVNVADSILESRDARLKQIVFRTFARNHCSLWFQQPPDGARVVASGTGTSTDSGNEPVEFWIEEGQVPITERYAYDEDAIGAAAEIVDNRILLAEQLPFTVIEIAIAMTKVLAYSKSPDVDGKWVFGQLKLARPLPRHYRDIAVLQKSIVANRFSNNAITVDGEPLGDMRFIVGAP